MSPSEAADASTWVSQSFANAALDVKDRVLLIDDPWIPEGNETAAGVRPAVRIFLGTDSL